MPATLLKHLINSRSPRAFITEKQNRHDTYDVVIIGGGGHGLATAYYLAREHNIKRIAVLEKSWLAGGNTARNTAIVRSNYLTPEAVLFYQKSMELFQGLSLELGINIMYSQRGHLTLAHTESACRASRWRANVNQMLGVESRYIDDSELHHLCPILNLSKQVRYPILGALYHPTGAIARHDAVAWGYAMRASEMGVHIFDHSEVVDIIVDKQKARAVKLSDGSKISAGAILQAVAGDSPKVAAMAGLRHVPITIIPLQAMVSQPLAPILDPIVVSGSLHIYVSQTPRGELVMGGALDPYPLQSTRSSVRFKCSLADHLLQLFPCFAHVNILRQWGGKADMTPDFSPIMGLTPIDNYYIDAGWGTWGFKATPVSGMTMASTIAKTQTHPLIKAYSLDRFQTLSFVGEKGAAAVGH